MADGVDGGVDATTLGGVSDDVSRALLCQVDGHRPERLGDVQPLLHGVDCQHRRRAGGDGDLHGAQPDRAEPEHRDTVPGPDAPGGDRVIPGAHDVAGEQRHVVGDRLGDGPQGQVRHRNERLLRLGALERAERCAVPDTRIWSHLW